MALTNPQMLQAVGRVAVHAAIVEQQIHVAYWHYAGVPGQVGQVITETIRPTRLLEDIIKISQQIEAVPGRIADIEDISSTYKNLAQQRNEIVHWIWHSDAEDKEHKVFAPGYMRGKVGLSKPYTREQISNVADGLRALSKRLIAHTISDADLQAYRSAFGAERHAKLAPAPWLDTPPPPSPTPSRTRGKQK